MNNNPQKTTKTIFAELSPEQASALSPSSRLLLIPSVSGSTWRSHDGNDHWEVVVDSYYLPLPMPTYPPGAIWEPIPQSEYQDNEYHVFWGVEELDRAASWRHGRLPRPQEEIMADLPAGKTYICMRRKPEEAQDDV